MNLKIHHRNEVVLQHAGELLQAHQILIDAWYASWFDEQQTRAAALHRKKDAACDCRGFEPDRIAK